MHTQLASGGRIEAVHPKQQPIVMRLIALLLVSVFSLAAPSVSRASFRVIHVFVALADNEHQGIIPVPPALGNGEDPSRNLYWGAAYGVRTFFRTTADRKEISSLPKPKSYILERSIFRHRASGTILIADAYEGSEIKQALTDFFRAPARLAPEMISFPTALGSKPETVPASPELVVYVGHDGLMDFSLPLEFPN